MGAARASGRGITNAQFRNARRNSSLSGRPRALRSMASVIEHSASLVSLRVFAATCPQRASRYSSAKAYQLGGLTSPPLPPPEVISGSSLTARTNKAPSSSASALTLAPFPVACPRRDCTAPAACGSHASRKDSTSAEDPR